MKKYVGVLVSLVLLTACSEADERESESALPSASYAEAPSTVADETTEASEGPPSPERSSRGNIIKQVGEQGGIRTAPGSNDQALTFVVDEIVLDYQCEGPYPSPSENGQFILVRMTVTTTEHLAKLLTPPTAYLSEQDFSIVGTDGVQENNTASIAAFSCAADSDRFPMAGIGPNVTAKGGFVIDTKNASGFIVFKPFGAAEGWEWQY